MNQRRRLHVWLILLACAVSLAGCRRGTDDAAVTASAAPAATAPAPSATPAAASVESPASPPGGVLLAYVWDCDDGTSLVMQNLLAERAISLELPEGTRRLPQAISASGAKYDDGSLVFWTKGDTAMLERAGGPTVNCRESRAKSLVADARARGVAYRGQGNEPGWVIEVGPPGRLVFVTNYGQERHEFTNAKLTGDAAVGAEYRAERDKLPIVATVTLEPCQDDMSGAAYDYSVVVEFGGRSYRGCGSDTR